MKTPSKGGSRTPNNMSSGKRPSGNKDSGSKVRSPGNYNDLVRQQQADEKGRYTPSKFGYKDTKSEVKDKYTQQDMVKTYKAQDMFATSSRVKPGYGCYDTQYHDEYIEKDCHRDRDHQVHGRFKKQGFVEINDCGNTETVTKTKTYVVSKTVEVVED